MLDRQGIEGLIGQSFKGYRITRFIDRGGMGVVFEGVQASLDRQVAIKMLYPHLSGDKYFRERFEREARAAARLLHSNIVRVLDFGSDGQLYFMVMDYVEGISLRDRLAQVHAEGLTLQMDTIINIVKQVGGALSYAHRLGYVHRDVKPGNILLNRDGQALLTDFGVVKILGDAAVTTQGLIIGTPEYMAPEQSSGEGEIGPAADQYSLAVVAYEMMVGRVPFRAPTPVALMRMHLVEPPPAPSSIVRWFPPQLEAVLLRALAKKPEERYESIDALLSSLLVAAGPEPQGAVAWPSATGATGSTLLPAQTSTSAGAVVSPAPEVKPEATAAGAWPLRLPRQFVLGGALAALVLIAALAGFLRLGVPLSSGASGDSQRLSAVPATTGPIVAPTEARTAVAAPSPTAAPTAAVGAPSPTTAPTTAPTAAPTAAPTVAAAVGAPSPTAAVYATTSAAPASREQLVVLFSSHRGDVHDSQIYLMQLDGSAQRQLTTNRGHSHAPRVTPDGLRIMYSSVAPGEHVSHSATGGSGTTSAGNHDIYVAELRWSREGSINSVNTINLTRGITAWDNAWSWSPDGKWIAFSSDRDGNWEIYVMTASGSNVRRLTSNSADDGWPVWTPDGKNIVFSSLRDGNEELYVLDADGMEKNVRRLTNRPATKDSYPQVSPDGKRIVFASQYQAVKEGQIHVMNIDGSEVRQLTDTVALNNIPSWCPDGTKIVFVSDRDGNDNIYIIDASGSSEKRLTTDPGEDTTPTCAYIRPAAP